MTKLLDEAITALRHVPLEHQDEIARVVMQLAGKEQPIYMLTPEEDADLAESDAAAERGEFATDEQMQAVWAKHSL
jgi:hypothetical protein